MSKRKKMPSLNEYHCNSCGQSRMIRTSAALIHGNLILQYGGCRNCADGVLVKATADKEGEQG